MSEQKQRSKDIIRTANIAESAHPRLKICGLSRPCDIEWVNDAGVEFCGFVFIKEQAAGFTRAGKTAAQHVKKRNPGQSVFLSTKQ